MDEDDESRMRLAKDGIAEDGIAEDGPGLERADTGGERPVDAFVSGAAYACLGLLGGVFGVLGAFLQGWTAGPVPVTSIALVALVFAMARLAGTGMGGRLGATVPAVVWAVVVSVLSLRRSEGDLVIPGTVAGYVFIIGGMVAAVAGVMTVPPGRPPGEWLLGGARR